MSRSLFMTRWCGASVLYLLTLTVLGASGPSPRRILILDPFGRDVAPFSYTISAFRATLARELGAPAEFHEVPLDLARFAEPAEEEPLVAFLEGRINSRPVDLVVPVGLVGAQFAARHRERLFSNTPILVVSGDPRFIPPDLVRTNAALVTHRVDLPGMVEDILLVQPQTTNIVVVFGASPYEDFWVAQFRREFQSFTNRVAFTWLNDLSLEQILEQCAHLPPRSFILHGMFVVDAAGVPSEKNEALRRLHAVANAPLFSYFASSFGLGPIGGRLYQDSEVGIQGARAAIRILRGESPGGIPPQVLEPTGVIYDWRELHRWGIRENHLPPGSVIHFRQPDFWERYRWFIIGIITFILMQTGLIAALVVNRAKRMRADQALRESEQRMTLAAEAAGFGVWVWNVPGNEVWGSDRWLHLFGFDPNEQLSLEKVTRRIHPDDRETVERAARLAMADGKDFTAEFRTVLPDGSQRWIAARGRGSPDQNGKPTRMLGAALDITVRRQTEASLHDLSRRLIQAHEAERARLARELHDDVTQRLARLAIDAARIEQRADERTIGNTVRSLREDLVHLSEDIHALSYRLHPSVLEDLGLAEALKAECERFSHQESIPTEVTLRELSEAVPLETALCLFRILQEALRNVARHAKAQRVQVSLLLHDDGLQLVVSDNGIGFQVSSPRAHPSLGLASMCERVGLIGGELDIESAPGQGTNVLAWVPLKEKDEGRRMKEEG